MGPETADQSTQTSMELATQLLQHYEEDQVYWTGLLVETRYGCSIWTLKPRDKRVEWKHPGPPLKKFTSVRAAKKKNLSNLLLG
jgi:hypothetical protein